MAAETFDESYNEQQQQQHGGGGGGDNDGREEIIFSDERKIHVSRIPSSFDEKAVKRLLEEHVGKGTVEEVVLIFKRPEDETNNTSTNTEGGDKDADNNNKDDNDAPKKKDQIVNAEGFLSEHRGFGYVTFTSEESQQKAIDMDSVKGGRKASSSKKHTLYIRPYAKQEQESDRQLCYLWAKSRCPYGDDCKFEHVGEGGCLVKNTEKKKQKCFAFKKGKCKKGDECPFSHDFVPTTKAATTETKGDEASTEKKDKKKKSDKPDSEKDCFTWKTKGKCRKGDKCPYKHDEALQQAALLKKKRKNPDAAAAAEDDVDGFSSKRNKRGNKQPLWVRVFGLNYDTTSQTVRELFQHCGPIMEVQFPRFDDSGRSKGYCGILFQSPKAVTTAMELDGQELMGRWLRVQTGKMLLDQWEDREKQQEEEMKKEMELPLHHDVY